MILSLLATVAVLAAIAVIAAALVLAETILVYIALGLAGLSVLLLLGAIIQGRFSGSRTDTERTDGLGKSSVPVVVAAAAGTAPAPPWEPEESGRVPAPAEESVRESAVSEHPVPPGHPVSEPGPTAADETEEEAEFEVPRWQTPTMGSWPEPAVEPDEAQPVADAVEEPDPEETPAEAFTYRIPAQNTREDREETPAEDTFHEDTPHAGAESVEDDEGARVVLTEETPGEEPVEDAEGLVEESASEDSVTEHETPEDAVSEDAATQDGELSVPADGEAVEGAPVEEEASEDFEPESLDPEDPDPQDAVFEDEEPVEVEPEAASEPDPEPVVAADETVGAEAEEAPEDECEDEREDEEEEEGPAEEQEAAEEQPSEDDDDGESSDGEDEASAYAAIPDTEDGVEPSDGTDTGTDGTDVTEAGIEVEAEIDGTGEPEDPGAPADPDEGGDSAEDHTKQPDSSYSG